MTLILTTSMQDPNLSHDPKLLEEMQVICKHIFIYLNAELVQIQYVSPMWLR